MPKETIIALLVIAVTVVAAYAFYRMRTRKRRKEREKQKKIKQKVKKLSRTRAELSPEEFMRLRAQTFGNGAARHDKLNFEGVYVLFNVTKSMYYVGQGKKVLDRVNMHFTGKGNGDVYADYKYGDEFTIKIIGLKHSGYRSLNALERDTISTFEAYAKGYNKTKGNKD